MSQETIRMRIIILNLRQVGIVAFSGERLTVGYEL